MIHLHFIKQTVLSGMKCTVQFNKGKKVRMIRTEFSVCIFNELEEYCWFGAAFFVSGGVIMKKISALIAAVAIAFLNSSFTVCALDELKYNDDDVKQYTITRNICDIDGDGEVKVNDLVRLNEFLHLSNISLLYYLSYDCNLDGNIDVFDLIALRKAIIDPEKAYKQTLNCDILETAEKSNVRASFLSSTEEVRAYLSELGTDEKEIKKYLELYDSKFFEKNDLVLGTMEQPYGNGIHHFPMTAGFMPLYPLAGVEEEDPDYNKKVIEFFEQHEVDYTKYDTIAMLLLAASPNYKGHPATYPKKNNILLMQCNVPKGAGKTSDDLAVAMDLDVFGTDYSEFKYESPDKKGRIEVYVADDSFWDPDFKFYIYYYDENDERTFIGGQYKEMVPYQPFSEKGEWKTDNDGNKVFSGSSGSDCTFSITWYKDRVEVKYESKSNKAKGNAVKYFDKTET